MESSKKRRDVAPVLKAEDYEAAIVIGFYVLQNREFDSNSSGVSNSIYQMLNEHPEVLASGKKIAQAILNKFPNLANEQAVQFGRNTSKVSAFWLSHNASNPTPKTDILIGDMRFSLKIGLAQLMSGGKAESTATFYTALDKSDVEIESVAQCIKVNNILEDFVTASLAPTQLRKIIKSGENEIVNRGEAAHKEIMLELGLLFEQNSNFKIEFAREAMSGFCKFGESNLAAAEYMIATTHEGSPVSIHSVYDDDYCGMIADEMRLQARFKTSSRKLKGKKTGEYNYWSVISLIARTINNKLGV
jgi:hypothetical protein